MIRCRECEYESNEAEFKNGCPECGNWASRMLQKINDEEDKRIARKCDYEDGYFTVEMLRGIKQVRKGIKGIDPAIRITPSISKGVIVALRKNLVGVKP